MNHIDYVIEQSVLDKLNKLAYQAVNDSEGFRKLMLVAIIDDLIQWSESLGCTKKVEFLTAYIQNLVATCRNTFIIPNELKSNLDVFTDVNIPEPNIPLPHKTLIGIPITEQPEGMEWAVIYKSINEE